MFSVKASGKVSNYCFRGRSMPHLPGSETAEALWIIQMKHEMFLFESFFFANIELIASKFNSRKSFGFNYVISTPLKRIWRNGSQRASHRCISDHITKNIRSSSWFRLKTRQAWAKHKLIDGNLIWRWRNATNDVCLCGNLSVEKENDN